MHEDPSVITSLCREGVQRILVEGLSSAIRHSMSSNWSNNKHTTLQKLAYEATSLTKLYKAALSITTTNTHYTLPNGNK